MYVADRHGPADGRCGEKRRAAINRLKITGVAALVEVFYARDLFKEGILEYGREAS